MTGTHELDGAVVGVVAGDDRCGRKVWALGRHQHVCARHEPAHRVAVEGEQTQRVGDAHGVLGGPHALADDVDDDQMQRPVGQHDPVVEVAARRRTRVGREVVHAELGRLDGGDHRAHCLLQLVDDLALGRLQLGKAVHRAEVLEGGAEVGHQRCDRRLGPLVEAVGSSAPYGVPSDASTGTAR